MSGAVIIYLPNALQPRKPDATTINQLIEAALTGPRTPGDAA
jgi:hypothetical protein